MKACTIENKKDTTYCCNEMPGLDINCCSLRQNVQFIHYGDMDVHGTALILEGGGVSSIPSTSDGKHMFYSAMGTSTLNIDR